MRMTTNLSEPQVMARLGAVDHIAIKSEIAMRNAFWDRIGETYRLVATMLILSVKTLGSKRSYAVVEMFAYILVLCYLLLACFKIKLV